MREKQVFHNAKWIILCKIAQSVLQLIIGMISARYLGPSNYGLISYAASVVAFAVPLMKLGFDSILVYELVRDPDKEGEIVGTSLFFNALSALLGILGVCSFVSLVNRGDTETILVCVLYSISLFFGALEMIQYWFQYKLLSKYSSMVMLITYVFVSAYKIFLLITERSVYFFALSHSIEYILMAMLLIAFYCKKGGQRMRISFSRARRMLSKSKYYIFASLMVVVIQNTDHIMVTAMYGESENGFYSAAITCVTILQFVYVAIVDSFRPLVLEEKKHGSEAYEKNIKRVYSITLYLSIAQCVVFCALADLIVFILYGSAYAAAVPVLRILSFYFIFSLMGLLRNVWILAEEKQKYLTVINFSGALLNIVLNAVMIPYWGAIGAATASFITQLFTNFLLGFIIKALRPNNRLMLQSLNPKFFVSELKSIMKTLMKKE